MGAKYALILNDIGCLIKTELSYVHFPLRNFWWDFEFLINFAFGFAVQILLKN